MRNMDRQQSQSGLNVEKLIYYSHGESNPCHPPLRQLLCELNRLILHYVYYTVTAFWNLSIEQLHTTAYYLVTCT
jgi:hypothetical protein